jgi:hypothetical protein
VRSQQVHVMCNRTIAVIALIGSEYSEHAVSGLATGIERHLRVAS